MLVPLGDFLRQRKDKNINWPTKEIVYIWNHANYYGFRDRCVRKLSRKILINEHEFDNWLESSTSSAGKV